MKPVVTYPDAEELVVTFLGGIYRPAHTVGVGVPRGFGKGSKRHLQVAWDGTPSGVHPLAENATIRVVAHVPPESNHTEPSQTDAKALASEARGLLLAGPWPDGISNVRHLTGTFPAIDPQTKAALASFTVQVRIRSVTTGS